VWTISAPASNPRLVGGAWRQSSVLLAGQMTLVT
jgi:hypothetical protein